MAYESKIITISKILKATSSEIERHKSEVKMAVVFLSQHLERFYSKMKDYFTNELNIPTQFII